MYPYNGQYVPPQQPVYPTQTPYAAAPAYPPQMMSYPPQMQAPAPYYPAPTANPYYPTAAPQMAAPVYPQTTGYYPAAPQMMAPQMAAPMAPMAAPVGYATPAATGYYNMPRMLFEFQLRGINLGSRDIFSKSDPFLIISSTTKDPYAYKMKKEKKEKKFGKTNYNKVTVYKTETVQNNQNPSWKPFTIDATVLCNNNFDQPFLVEVWDWDHTGVHDLIGKATTTLREIQVMKELTLVNPSKKHNPLYRAGMVAVDKCTRVQ